MSPGCCWMRSASSGLLQINFGQDQVEGGGCIADESRHLLPVFRLGGELVAGDDGPFGKSMPGLGRRILGV